MNVSFTKDKISFKKYETNKTINGYRMMIDGDESHCLAVVFNKDKNGNVLYELYDVTTGVLISYSTITEHYINDIGIMNSIVENYRKNFKTEDFITKVDSLVHKKLSETPPQKKQIKSFHDTYYHNVYTSENSTSEKKSIIVYKNKIPSKMLIKVNKLKNYSDELEDTMGYPITFEVFLDQDINFAIIYNDVDWSITEVTSGISIASCDGEKTIRRITVERLIQDFEYKYNNCPILKSDNLKQVFDEKNERNKRKMEKLNMNIVRLTRYDTANGPGVRIVLWVAGCEHFCKNCQQPETWDFNAGKPFNEYVKKEIFDFLAKPFIKGITFSGGDPLHPKNFTEITKLAKEIRTVYPMKSIWCYTGYSWEEIKDFEIMEYLDVLVDGEYHDEERSVELPYCGSENQRVIDVKKTRETGNFTLFWKNDRKD